MNCVIQKYVTLCINLIENTNSYVMFRDLGIYVYSDVHFDSDGQNLLGCHVWVE